MSERRMSIMKFAVSFALLLIAYIPTFVWMVRRWTEAESYYGHGFFIPLVSLFIVWQRKDLLKKVTLSSEFSGLFFVTVALVTHIICSALKVYFVSGLSFVCALFGLILFFLGKELARRMIFPVFFLLAMVPLPLVIIGNLTVKLKLFVAQVATIILNHIGFPSVRDGSVIRMPNSFIAIEAPCSGLRSLISLLTLGLLFSCVSKMSYPKKSVLFLSSAPIALASNVMRIILVAVVNDLYGEKVAMGFFHDFSGFLLFGVAFAGLFAVSRALEKERSA